MYRGSSTGGSNFGSTGSDSVALASDSPETRLTGTDTPSLMSVSVELSSAGVTSSDLLASLVTDDS